MDLTSATRAQRRPPVGDLIRLLFSEAERRIQNTPRPNMYEVPRLSKQVQKVWRAYQKADALRSQLNKRLEREGLSPDSSKDLSVCYKVRQQRETQWNTQQHHRKVALKDLRLKVGMDLLGMSNMEARKYLKALQKTLAKL